MAPLLARRLRDIGFSKGLRALFIRISIMGKVLKDLKTVQKDLKDLLESQPLAVLATQNKGNPYANLVAFAFSEDLKSLFFATTRATRKYANLTADKRVAMLADNRSNQASDFRQAKAVTVRGRAEEIDKDRGKRFLEIYLTRHPQLEEFVTAPSCAFLRIRVDTYYLVTHFQDVIEIHVTES